MAYSEELAIETYFFVVCHVPVEIGKWSGFSITLPGVVMLYSCETLPS